VLRPERSGRRSLSKRLKFSDAALEDLADIRGYTVAFFGARQAERYEVLLGQAFADIEEDPYRPYSKARLDLGDGFRSYRVELSRNRSGSGVKSSPHVVLYVELMEHGIGVSRVLHDSMVMQRHIPPEHREGPEAFGRDEEE
jgi:toxin ParE1/3/4